MAKKSKDMAEMALSTIGMFHILSLNNEQDAANLYGFLIRQINEVAKMAKEVDDEEAIINYNNLFIQLTAAIVEFREGFDLEKVRQLCMNKIREE